MNAIVADGRGRWLGAWGHEIESRAVEWFALELSQAGWWRRQLILWRIRRRVAVILRRSEPSASALW